MEQQVSLASARSAFEKLRQAVRPLTPAGFLQLSEAELKMAGFSRQKAAYGRALAEALLSGELDLPAVARLEDAPAKAQLMTIRGIGSWTADIYLLMALGRPDIWPAGDLALEVALQRCLDLPARPGPAAFDAIGRRWQPWRAVAARILWHFYLSLRRRGGPAGPV